MRTSILLDDDLAERFRVAAKEKGQSLSAFLADAGREALRSKPRQKSTPFVLETYGEGGVRGGVNLDRTGDLLVAEDAEGYGRSTE